MIYVMSTFVVVVGASVVLDAEPAAAGLKEVFELDGDAVDDTPGVAPDDFEDIYDGSNSALASVFVAEGIDDGSYFTGGGSKDTENLDQWLSGGIGIPDKNEVTNAYAATYLDPFGDTILYLGIDRYENAGAASMGFWLLQQEVTVNPADNTFDDSTGAPAQHQEGDMLIVADFQGGTPQIRTFFWQSGTLVLSTTVINDCRTAPTTDAVCGSANDADIPSPWPYTPKSGVAGTFPVDSYLEVGVNLNTILGTGVGCFNTLVANSRSTTAEGAQLKDLLLTEYKTCGTVGLQKTGPDLATSGETVTYAFTINGALIEMTVDSFVDDVLGDLTTVAQTACPTIPAAGTCSFTHDYTVPAGSSPGTIINTATVSLLPPSGIGAVVASDDHTLELYQPAVNVVKSGPVAGTLGDSVTYSFAVTNTSVDAPTLPAPGLVIDSVIDDKAGAATYVSGDTNFNGLVDVGETWTYTADYTILATDPDPVVNVVTVTAHGDGSTVTVQDTDSHSMIKLVPPDLVLTKDDGVLSAGAGTQVTYTLTYSNVGPGDSTGTVITETVPANSTFNAGASTAGWVCTPDANAGSTCTLSLGTVAAGAGPLDVAFVVDLDSPLASGIVDTTNNASIADDGANGPDVTPADNSTSHVTPIDAAPDLTISKDDGTLTEVPGTLATYVIGYSNDGTQDATGVVITDTVPVGTTFNAAGSDAGWSCVDGAPAGSVCTLTVGNLAVAGTGTVNFAVDIDAAATGSLVNTASIADDAANGADLTPADNTVTDTDTLAPSADLSITKTDDVDPVAAGAQLTYTLRVDNAGPSAATLVQVADTLPAGVTLSSVASSQGGCTSLPCDLGTIAPGGFATVTVVVDVAATTVGTITNSATVTSSTADPVATNNTVTEDTLVLNADVGIGKTVDDSTPPEGGTVTYTITVTNAGPDTAEGVSVADLLPTGVTYVSDNGLGLYVSGTGVWTIGDLTNGASASLEIVASVDASTSGTTITNTAVASAASPGDVDPANNTASVDITVNVAPVAVDDSATTDEDTAVSGDVATNDTDVDGTLDLTSVVLVTDVANGALTLNADGSYSYTPDADFFGTDSFTYTVLDDDGAISNTATVTITVNDVNDPPVAVDDSATTDEDTAVSGDVATNDTDVDGTLDLTSVVLVTDVANGTLTLNADGSYSYTPDADFFGTDSFTYTVLDDDGAISNTATVTITVNDVNDPPVAVDDSATTDEDTAVSGDVATNDTDVDGTLDLTSVVLVTDVANGTLTLNADGSYSYTPDADFFGTDSFTYTVLDDDGAISNTATVTITVNDVNDPPVAVDDSATTDEDTAVSGDVATNDTDVDGTLDLTSVVLVTDVANGTLTLNADGSYSYTPDADFFGTDSFTYTVLDDDGAISNTATVTITVNDVNDPPVAVDDSATTDEDTAVSGDVATNDTDVDGTLDLTSVVLVTDVANGTLTLNADGSYSYTPDADFFGTDSFTYTVLDDDGAISNTATVTITVNDVNDPPVAVDDSATTDEDTAVSGDVATNDTDVDGTLDLTSVVLVTDVANGTLTLNADGSYSYTPDADFFGTDSFTYTVLDDDGAISNTATVTITVNDVNDPPVAVDDSATTDEDTAVSGDVATNDTDVDGTLDLTSVVLVTDVANGTLTLNADGSYSYTPDADFFGTDSFTYTVLDDDGAISNTATVTITVNDVNDPPVAVDDSATTDEDTAVSGDVATNDTDVDGTLDLTSVVLVTDVANGTLTLNADGSYSYTPDADFFGTDSFTYTVLDDDGAISNTATVTITVNDVNDPPVAVDDSATTDEDTAVSGDVATNDTDVDGTLDLTSVVLVTDVANGTLTLNADGSYSYTPDADFFGTDSFTYTVLDDDGAISNTATVTITVNDVNDPPVAVDDSATTDEDTAVSGDVATNDTDVDGTLDLTSVVLVTDVANGTLTLNADGSYSYTPDADFFGTDSFTYTVLDDDGAISNTATVTITVNDVNDPPVAVDDSATTDEDTAVSGDVATNDTDVDGTLDLTSVVLVTDVANGTLTLNADGSYSYTPDADFFGTDSFTYTVLDDDGAISNTATVTITVNDVNDPPVAVDDSATTDEDTAVSGDVATNDTDVDGTLDLTSVVLVTDVANGTLTLNADGSYSYTPDADFFGTDSFTYTVLDDDGAISNTATVTITVNDVNDPPVAVDDSATTDEDTAVSGDVATNDTDVDGTLDLTSVVLVTDVANGTLTLNADGSYSYTPDADFFGTDSFTYTVLDDDGAISNTATVTITVNDVNDPPVAVDDSATTDEDTAVSGDVATNDTDVDGTLDLTSVVLVTDVANGTLTLNADGSYSYTPDADFFGTDSFTYTVLDDDGAISNTATVTITVNDVNDPPVAVDDSATTDEDTAVSGDVATNDTDVDGTLDLTSVVLVTDVANGTLTLNADGSYSYTPDADFFGTDSFTYTVLDDDGAISNTATVTITVNDVNDPPVAVDDSATTDEDTAVSGDVATNDTDVDGTLDLTSVVLVTDVANGTLTLNADGSYSYTPDADFFGTDSFTYTVLDDDGAISNTATVTITVNDVNDPPVAVDDSATTDEDTAVSGDVATNDTDVDGTLDLTSVVLVTDVANGTLTLNADGSYSYTPDADFFGTDSFTYTVLDDDGAISNTATVTITVNDVNDPPVAVDDSATTDEDTAVSGDVATNDTDVDGTLDLTSVVLVTDVANGTLTLNADGSYSYTPDADFFGTDSFTYTVLDDDGAISNTATVTITVNDVNDPPVAVDDSATTDEDTAVSGDVATNDTDVDGTLDLTSVVLVTDVANGTLTLNADGSYSYTPDADFFGTDSFTYTVLDDDGAISNTATVTITVNDVNDPPVAVDDSATTDEDTAVSGDVATNDTDVDGTLDLTSVVLVTDVANGTLTLNADGSYSYTPDADFFGTDSFTYTVLDDDGAISNTATVTITVNDVNDPPVAVDDSATTDEDTAVSGDVATNDTDVDGTLDLTSVVLVTDVANGTLTLNADGSYSYTPDADFFGTDSFTYTVLDDDGAISNTATVTITVNDVNDPPVAVDDSATTDEDTAVSGDVATNDTDVDGTLDLTSVVLVTDVANGTLTLNADGSYSYTPDADFFGTDSFTYTVLDDDGAISNTATVTITVNDVNDPPVAVDDVDFTLQNTSVTTDVLANDSDVDGTIDSSSVTVGDGINPLLEPTDGTVVVNGDGTITYTPDTGFSGTDTYEYQVCDNDGDCSIATVTITVDPNAAPVATDNAYSVDEDAVLTGGDVITDDTGAGIDSDV